MISIRKFFYLPVIIAAFFNRAQSQNLIPNPGFDIYTGCPYAIIDSIQDWINPTNGSPDYYVVCAGNVPNSWAGSQYPHSGDSYLGIVIKNSGGGTLDWREYLECPLINPLVPGNHYVLSMYANLAEYSMYGSSSIAGLFTTYPLFVNSNLPIPVTPQAINDSSFYITDLAAWQLIEIPFTADSAYSYVTIGNFFPDALTTFVFVQNAADPRSYIFLDDVSLVEDPDAIDENSITSSSTLISPNPVNENIKIEFDLAIRSTVHINIINQLSQVMETKKFQSLLPGRKKIIMDFKNYPAGIYFIKINMDGKEEVRKIIKL